MTSTEQLNIYYLAREIPPGIATYEEMVQCVVIAADPLRARGLASEMCGDEGPDAWKTDTATVTLLGTAVENAIPRVPCRDVHEA